MKTSNMKTTNETNSQNTTSVVQPVIRRWSRRGFLGACLAAAVLALFTFPAQAAPTLSGTYVTPTKSGTITFTPLRAFRGGVEGRFVISGKAWPGSIYSATGGGTGMVWYYGTTGIMAGNALVTTQPNGSGTGPIWFFDRKGNTIDAGTVTLP
jgi:hypothetical protein